jgi:protein SCO1
VKVQDERSRDYSIDHAGVIYLIGRNGEYLGFMPPQTNPDRLTEVLRKNLAN